MKKDKLLLEEYENGNEKALEELIKNILYIIKNVLDRKKHDKNDEEDLVQEGMILLANYIKKYLFDSQTEISLKQYLSNSLNMRFDTIINKYNKNRLQENDNLIEYDEKSSYDFISEMENMELIKELKNFIVKTNYFTFLQKNILISKGFINEIVLSETDLSNAFNTSYQNFYVKKTYAASKLKKAYFSKIYQDKDEYKRNDDLFSFMETSKEIVLYEMKHLNKREIKLIKMVWGNDFTSIKELSNINFSKEDLIEYYNAIGKLFRSIQNLSDDEIMENILLESNNYHRIIY